MMAPYSQVEFFQRSSDHSKVDQFYFWHRERVTATQYCVLIAKMLLSASAVDDFQWPQRITHQLVFTVALAFLSGAAAFAKEIKSI
jgi:hypothetical protein